MLARLLRSLSGKGRRTLLAALIGLVVLSGISAATLLYFQHGAVHAAAASDPRADQALLIHGFSGKQDYGSGNSVPGGCTYFGGDMANYLGRKGWNAPIKTVGYYRVDGDSNPIHYCNVNFYSGATEGQEHQSHCDTYFFSIQAEGTNNQDLKNLACQLAWYIYNNYTTYGLSVRIIAHSMGGMIVRWALHQISMGDTKNFPPVLYVPEIVTIATPHDGAPNPGAAGIACGGCVQASELEGTTDYPDFISSLRSDTSNGRLPGGEGWGTTDWTLLSSICDSWIGLDPVQFPQYAPNFEDPGVDADSAMALPGIHGVPGTHKFLYLEKQGDFAFSDPPPTPSRHNCNPPSTSGFLIQWGYTHNNYLHDTADTADQGYEGIPYGFCDGCGGEPSNDIPGQPHALQVVFNALVSYAPSLPPQVVNVPNGGQFLAKWIQFGGAGGQLGMPRDGWYTWSSVSGGQAQDFTACSGNGHIYWSAATGTRMIKCAIAQYYLGHLGGPDGMMGFPMSDEYTVAYGWGNDMAGPKCGSSGGGHIYYSTPSQAHEIHGCIASYYLSALHGPAGFLGFPTSDEYGVAGGRANQLEGTYCGSTKYGHIWFSGNAHETYGCIEQEYLNLGGPGGFLGFPKTGQQSIAGGSYNDFAGGTCGSSGGGHIYDSSTTGAHEVHGCIAIYYLGHLGGPGGPFGFPISDEFPNARTGYVESDFLNGCVIWTSSGARSYLYSDPSSNRYCD